MYLSISIYVCIYIYICIYVSACVCVCVWLSPSSSPLLPRSASASLIAARTCVAPWGYLIDCSSCENVPRSRERLSLAWLWRVRVQTRSWVQSFLIHYSRVAWPRVAASCVVHSHLPYWYFDDDKHVIVMRDTLKLCTGDGGGVYLVVPRVVAARMHG